jgi:hypothetical protein
MKGTTIKASNKDKDTWIGAKLVSEATLRHSILDIVKSLG